MATLESNFRITLLTTSLASDDKRQALKPHPVMHFSQLQ